MPSAQMSAPALDSLRNGKLAGTWVLDEHRSQVRFQTRSMWGLAPVSGLFRQVTGTVAATSGGDVTGTVTISAASIDTRNKRRDDHLRSAAFFEVSRYPDITYAVDGVSPAAAGVSVRGRLAVHGTTRPTALAATVSAFDGDELWLDAEVNIDRSDFGMLWSPMGMASMKNAITLRAVFARR